MSFPIMRSMTARILTVPDGTVKSRLSRGRLMLREKLQAYRAISGDDEM